VNVHPREMILPPSVAEEMRSLLTGRSPLMASRQAAAPGGDVVNVSLQGPVYGLPDFKEMVGQIVRRELETSRWLTSATRSLGVP